MALSLSPSRAAAISESIVFLDHDSSAHNFPQVYNQQTAKNNDSIVLSPWLANDPPILNREWIKVKKSQQKPRSIITCPTRERIAPKSVEICQEEYKMNRTFLQFRIKANNESLAKKRAHSDRNGQFCGEGLEKVARSTLCRKNITALHVQAQKSPKLKFLERKLRLKESLVSSLKRKKRMQAREADYCYFDIAFADFHEPAKEQRDNLTSLRLRKGDKPRLEFAKWHSNQVLTIE